MSESITGITITSHKGFFYRTNNRGTLGVNWANNTTLPREVRECKHGIGVSKNVVLKIGPTQYLKAHIYYRSSTENREIYKGTYAIQSDKLMDWLKVNNLYTTKAGKEVLVIPVILWEIIKNGELPKETRQRKLL